MSAAARGHPLFDPQCRACARLTGLREAVRRSHPEYHAAPVAAFGDPLPRLLIVGLAPGMHGANRSGRPFTGDYAGILLYQTLHRFGFASQPRSEAANDGLQLLGCRVTNAVKCLPPQNRPTGAEVRTCNRYLAAELSELEAGTAILALGAIAHQAILHALGLKRAAFPFGHGRCHELPRQRTLFDSYHCSRYNTQTRRLTEAMFSAVFESIVDRLRRARPVPEPIRARSHRNAR